MLPSEGIGNVRATPTPWGTLRDIETDIFVQREERSASHAPRPSGRVRTTTGLAGSAATKLAERRPKSVSPR